jgi:hypothetical protein
VLWTGGWDSTYRLLYLLLVEGRRVEPIYLVDHERASTLHEVASMARTRERIATEKPFAASKLMPTRVFLVHEIAPCATITARFKSLASRFRVGSQYEWLPRFAEQHRFVGLELAVDATDPQSRSSVFPYLGQFLTEEDGNLKLSASVSDEDLLIFKYFHFPLFLQTKAQSAVAAKEHGFYDLLLGSWFCHRPRNGSPCGLCHPCLDAIESGFAFRLSPVARARSRFRSILKRGRSLVAKRTESNP